MPETYKTTLWELLAGCKDAEEAPVHRVLVPRIQRDYAHGRPDRAAESVREQLLSDLLGDGLVDLGLIFGARDGETIVLYDGQQRFTTLYLLHWYFAWRARDTGAAQTLARFSYESRLHSRDFCHHLAWKGLELDPGVGEGAPSERFLDAAWFCLAWRSDPSVDGMLVVLDALHKKAGATELAWESRWARLKKRPSPSFTWLVLDEGAANKDFYVKLNGRGRNLTDFEKLKAWIEGAAGNEQWPEGADSETQLPQNWQLKLDRQWTELFWEASAKDPDAMDRTMLTFFLGNALNLSLANAKSATITTDLVQTVHDEKFLSKDEWTEIFTVSSLACALHALGRLENKNIRDQIDEWAKRGNILQFSDKLSGKSLTTAWLAGWPEATYADRLLFFALLRFLLVSPPGSPGWNEEEFRRWMRCARNLAANSEIDGAKLGLAIAGIASLAESGFGTFDERLMERGTEGAPAGMNTEQWQDEVAKAEFRENHRGDSRASELFRTLEEAEDLGILRGRAGFLIKLATADEHFDPDRFVRYAKRISQLFDGDRWPKDRVPLQRALLACGDYSFQLAWDKWTFGSDRNEWRKIFASQSEKPDSSLVQALKDLPEGDPAQALDQLRQEREGKIGWSDWRKWLIASEKPLEFCEYSVIGWKDPGDTVILVSKSDYRSYTAELRTYFLFREHLESEDAAGDGGWRYAYGLREQSHAYRESDSFRLELRYVGNLPEEIAVCGGDDARPLVLRLVCADETTPPGSEPPWSEDWSGLEIPKTKSGGKRAWMQRFAVDPSSQCYPKRAADFAKETWDALNRQSTEPTAAGCGSEELTRRPIGL